MISEKKKILVVEDDIAIANGLKELLQSENYVATLCRDGESGVNRSLTISPDLVLLDIGLPKLNGFAVLDRLLEAGFDKPIIMLTSSAQEADKVRALSAGAIDYVTKPFSQRELLARIRLRLKSAANAGQRSLAPAETPSRGKYLRKLLAIMFTDIEGYSRIMNEDENLALRLLKLHNEKMNRAVLQFSGRVIETIGDAFLISFGSVSGAVECAVAVQKDFRSYRLKKPVGEHLHLRIGIHVGDVTITEGKIKGDAVNLAARVQQIAEPDCVFISENVFDGVKNKIQLKATDLGRKRVKNIEKPIRVYKIEV